MTEEAPSGKGRPTPKRREAQKRRRTAIPTNRKEAAKVRRERLREQRLLQRQALQSGDERHLPPRDAGPAKRLARDYVDSRFTLGQIFFGLVLVVLVISFTPNKQVAAYANFVMLLMFFGVAVSSWMVGRAARRVVEEKFGDRDAGPITTYAMLRAMQPRRMRRPPPKVKRGDAI